MVRLNILLLFFFNVARHLAIPCSDLESTYKVFLLPPIYSYQKVHIWNSKCLMDSYHADSYCLNLEGNVHLLPQTCLGYFLLEHKCIPSDTRLPLTSAPCWEVGKLSYVTANSRLSVWMAPGASGQLICWKKPTLHFQRNQGRREDAVHTILLCEHCERGPESSAMMPPDLACSISQQKPKWNSTVALPPFYLKCAEILEFGHFIPKTQTISRSSLFKDLTFKMFFYKFLFPFLHNFPFWNQGY